jgi:hypothetical protein
MPRNGLLSQSLATQVPSALYRFTSRFGMGLGGSGTLLPRNKLPSPLFLLPHSWEFKRVYQAAGKTKRFGNLSNLKVRA